MEIEKFYYGNEEMENDLGSIVRDMALEDFRPDYIFAIARGGLVAGTYLSHYYNIPLLMATVSLRDHAKISDISEVSDALNRGKKVLLIDEICDSGETLALIRDTLNEQVTLQVDTGTKLENLKSAILVHNAGQDVFEPNFIGTEINKAERGVWVVFRWEQWWSLT